MLLSASSLLSAEFPRAQRFVLLGRAFPVTILAALTVRVLYYIFLHPLRRVPGPCFAKCSEAWRTWRYARGTWREDILNLQRQYGPVVRLSPNEVSIVDKDGLNRVFGHGKGTKKISYIYHGVSKLKFEAEYRCRARLRGIILGNPLLSASHFFHSIDLAEHSFLRKRVAAAYSMSTILSLESEIQDVASAVWEKLDEAASRKKPVDMHKWASYFDFDIVGKLALGAPIGFTDQEKDVLNIIKSIHAGFWQMAVFGYVPGQMKWIYNPISNFILTFLFNSASPQFQQWNGEQLAKRRAEPAGSQRKRDMLDHFISMKEPDGSPATDSSVLVEGGNIIGAGADTTSISIRTVVAQLILHPEDYLRVQEEVDDIGIHG